ncbi:MAG: LysE family translocator, partial [Campylobacteraceae bacterium]
MISLQTFLVFSITSIILALTPGPDILFVINQGITRGKKAAFALTVGLCSGIFVHTTIAALGISAIFNTSEIAFTILKVCGAAYLFYLSYKAFKHRNDGISTNTNPKIANLGYKKLIIRGFFMNVLNPKVLIFFFTILLPFAKAERGSIALQIIQLGAVFMICAFSVFCIVGMLSGKASEKIMKNQKVSKIANLITACLFLIIGILFILTQNPNF